MLSHARCLFCTPCSSWRDSSLVHACLLSTSSCTAGKREGEGSNIQRRSRREPASKPTNECWFGKSLSRWTTCGATGSGAVTEFTPATTTWLVSRGELLPRPAGHSVHRAYPFQKCWRKGKSGAFKLKNMSGDKWKSQLQLMPFVIQGDLTIICDQLLLEVCA